MLDGDIPAFPTIQLRKIRPMSPKLFRSVSLWVWPSKIMLRLKILVKQCLVLFKYQKNKKKIFYKYYMFNHYYIYRFHEMHHGEMHKDSSNNVRDQHLSYLISTKKNFIRSHKYLDSRWKGGGTSWTDLIW